MYLVSNGSRTECLTGACILYLTVDARSALQMSVTCILYLTVDAQSALQVSVTCILYLTVDGTECLTGACHMYLISNG